MNVIEASQRIALILAELERETGQLVRAVDIENIDITRFDDYRPQWKRVVQIKLDPIPGSTHWEV